MIILTMDKCMSSPFSSEKGEQIYKSARKTVEEYSMYPLLLRGVLVGLSGGADSVALLHFLVELRRREEYFPIVAVHINHMIRGDEANRDECFSEALASELGVEFLSCRVDVPKMAKERSLGIEEAARNARYSEFRKIISSRNDIDTIAVAHNSSDNLETVLFNIMRGSGSNGASGIEPVRDNIIRPLIDIDKASILEMLNICGIQYVTDSTNLDTDYTRNFLRHKVVLPIRELFSSPEKAVSRMSRNLRSDNEFINSVADDFIKSHEKIYASDLLQLHTSVFARVVMRLAAEHSSSLEEIHILSIRKLLSGGDFSVSIPGGVRFCSERGVCEILPEKSSDDDILNFPLKFGMNRLGDFDADVCLYNEKNRETSLNVYKNSIHAELSSAIIHGELYMRSRTRGDTIFYSGHTHKLRKIFTDLKIPMSERKYVLLLCDDKGVVWIPGLAVRDDGNTGDNGTLKVELLLGKGDGASKKRVHTVSEYRINTSDNENNK